MSMISYTEKGLDSAEVSWTEPQVTDNVDKDLLPILVSGQPPGSRFDVSSHVVTYSAIDSVYNEAYDCVFTIYIRSKHLKAIQFSLDRTYMYTRFICIRSAN